MAAPTLLDYAESDWTDQITAETTDDLNWNASGDRIVVLGATEDNGVTAATPTGTGITLGAMSGSPTNTGSSCKAYAWSATASADGNTVLTSTNGGTGARGIAAWAYSGSDGLGTPVINVGTGLTVSVTTSQDSSVVMVLADWNATTDVTVTAEPAADSIIRQNNVVSGLATFLVIEWANQAAGTRNYGVTAWTGTGTVSKIAVEVLGTASAAAIPFNPQRSVALRDVGEAYWLQMARRAAAGEDPNPLAAPLLTPQARAIRADRRSVAQQRPNLNAPAAAAEIPHAGAVPTPTRMPGAAAQPARQSPPGLLDTAQLEIPPADTAYAHLRTPWLRQNPARADQSTAAAGDVFDPTLAGSKLAYLSPALFAARSAVPQQRTSYADIDTVAIIGTGATGGWWGIDDTAHFLYGTLRRPAVPEAAAAPTDPLTVAWGAGGLYWLLYNTAALFADRREVPRQPDRESDPGLLLTSLLEGVLLGGADVSRRTLTAATHADRREVPAQRINFNPISVPDTDPLTVAAGTGGDMWRRTNVIASRRVVPQQPPRRTLTFDGGPGLPPLTVAWGTGGILWHLYNRPSRDRPWWPPPPRYDGNAVADAIANALSTPTVTAGRTSASTVTASRTSSSTVTARASSSPTVSDG